MRDIMPAMDVPLVVYVVVPVFLLMFWGLVAFVYSKRRRGYYEQAGKLPLDN